MPGPRKPFLDRTGVMFALYFGIALVVFLASLATIYAGRMETLLHMTVVPRWMLGHWLNEGYFHYFGLMVRSPSPDVVIYRTADGGYMVSSFILEKLFVMTFGRYSWRLLAIHNQIISMFLAAVLGLLTYRLSRRIGLEARLAFAAGAAVVIVIFTFPANLALYWFLTSQAYFLLFAA